MAVSPQAGFQTSTFTRQNETQKGFNKGGSLGLRFQKNPKLAGPVVHISPSPATKRPLHFVGEEPLSQMERVNPTSILPVNHRGRKGPTNSFVTLGWAFCLQ